MIKIYVPDTMERMNQVKVDEHYAKIEAQVEKMENDESWEKAKEDGDYIMCYYCDEPADQAMTVYNPADGLRDVDGAYGILHVCEDCRDSGVYMEENFYCDGCGELFVYNHSWDVLAVTLDDGVYCQKCAADLIQPMTLGDLLLQVEAGDTSQWKRINSIPGRYEFWSGEFSQYEDFPGHTNFGSLRDSIVEAAEEHGIGLSDEVIPAVTQGYQFSVVLGIFY